MEVGTPEQRKSLRNVIEKGGREQIDIVKEAIASTDAIEYTFKAAEAEAAKAKDALEILPPSSYRSALATLADFSADRTN
jgi:octaprenyl-diphosphate synthase